MKILIAIGAFVVTISILLLTKPHNNPVANQVISSATIAAQTTIQSKSSATKQSVQPAVIIAPLAIFTPTPTATEISLPSSTASMLPTPSGTTPPLAPLGTTVSTRLPSVTPLQTSLPSPSSTLTPTPSPTATPTQTPNDAPSPTPVPTEEPTATPSQFSIEVLSLTTPITRGQKASMDIKTAKDATCSISVKLPSGAMSSSKDLITKTADSDGKINWLWTIGASTTPGTATISLSCLLEEQSVSGQVLMEITAAQ